jgi:hypothetical protein
MVQLKTLAEIESLNSDLDIFEAGRDFSEELISKGLYPPLPICSGTLIWGFGLLPTAKALRMRQLSCLDIPSCTRRQMLATALRLENRAGAFTWNERQRMLSYLSAQSSKGRERHDKAAGNGKAKPALAEAVTELSPLIENRQDPHLADRINAYGALPEAVKKLVRDDRIDLKTASRVQDLPAAVFRNLRKSGLTFSQARQFLNELFEISRKKTLSPEDTEKLAGRVLIAAQPHEEIHRLRFPTITSLEKSFSDLEQELLRGSGVHLSPPPYFEGDSYTINFSFNSRRSLVRKLNALHRLEGRCDALFELLH